MPTAVRARLLLGGEGKPWRVFAKEVILFARLPIGRQVPGYTVRKVRELITDTDTGFTT